MYPPLRDEALVNFEKKSERLTLHGETGFIPRTTRTICLLYFAAFFLLVVHVLHALHVLQALPILPVLQALPILHVLQALHALHVLQALHVLHALKIFRFNTRS